MFPVPVSVTPICPSESTVEQLINYQLFLALNYRYYIGLRSPLLATSHAHSDLPGLHHHYIGMQKIKISWAGKHFKTELAKEVILLLFHPLWWCFVYKVDGE